MKTRTACALAAAVLGLTQARAQVAPGMPAIRLNVDASDAPQRLLHATMQFPVKPGPLSLLYPRWIPGEHAPTGPIEDLAGVKMTANGQRLAWHRDDVDTSEFHVDVPVGVSELEVSLDFISPPASGGFSSGSSITSQLAVVSWNQVLLYPKGPSSDEIEYQPSLTIPNGWQFGTALPIAEQAGSRITFSPSSLTTLIDSPVQTGIHYRAVDLSPGGAVPHVLDIAADSERATRITTEEINHLQNMVAETNRLFGAHHYRGYHFLLTLSDHVAHFGEEHHESSDDRMDEDTLTDESVRALDADLLPHEFVHSWNGKFRRPTGLATPNYNEPMKDDLLWVYEGLTEYLGEILAPRSGLWTEQEYLDSLARNAAMLDNEAGRTWRTLEDTAVAAPLLYAARSDYADLRRGTDFYEEGMLIWLDVDVTIRTLSKGKKSLDDFCRSFAGAPSTGPEVRPYTFEDVVNTLNSVERYDWATFLRERLQSTSEHAPLNGILNAGYKLIYTRERSDFWKAREDVRKNVDLSYSLGLLVHEEGDILDVRLGTPAFQAGLAPAVKIIAVDGRQFSPGVLRQAVEDSAKSTKPITLIVRDGDYYKTFDIDYHGGEKYPHLVRNEAQPDLIANIIRSRVAGERAVSGGPQ